MRKIWQFIKEHPRDAIIGTIIVLLVVCGGPLLINWAFSEPAWFDFFAVDWNVEDALSYYGSALSFIGTVVLGAITVYQTREAHKQTEQANTQTEKANQLAEEALAQTQKANELSVQMQKLEQARFISMVSIVKFDFNRRDIGEENFYNKNIPNRIKFDMVDHEFKTFRECYHIDVMLKNESEYPIIELFVSGKGDDRGAKLLHGIKSVTNSFYIPPKGEQAARFIIPAEGFQKYPSDGLLLKLSFTNVFDYTTEAKIQIDKVGQFVMRNTAIGYSYQLQKITNVNPQNSVEEIITEST